MGRSERGTRPERSRSRYRERRDGRNGRDGRDDRSRDARDGDRARESRESLRDGRFQSRPPRHRHLDRLDRSRGRGVHPKDQNRSRYGDYLDRPNDRDSYDDRHRDARYARERNSRRPERSERSERYIDHKEHMRSGKDQFSNYSDHYSDRRNDWDERRDDRWERRDERRDFETRPGGKHEVRQVFMAERERRPGCLNLDVSLDDFRYSFVDLNFLQPFFQKWKSSP